MVRDMMGIGMKARWRGMGDFYILIRMSMMVSLLMIRLTGKVYILKSVEKCMMDSGVMINLKVKENKL